MGTWYLIPVVCFVYEGMCVSKGLCVRLCIYSYIEREVAYANMYVSMWRQDQEGVSFIMNYSPFLRQGVPL